MLEDGFKEELGEIVRHCPRGRQTMLFSASMTDDVRAVMLGGRGLEMGGLRDTFSG